MTTIGVVSDTHFPRFGVALPPELAIGLRAAGVARILHCGDHTDASAVRLLETIAPVEAVAGNNDGPELQARFGRRRIVVLDGVRVGLVHGDLGPGASTPARARRAFDAEAVDVICFGHSHQPYLEERDGRMSLNPGSATDKRREARYSYALLFIEDGRARAEIVRFG